MQIQEKYQLIDDDGQFKIQELQGLNKQHIQALKKSYHTLSIIGSQSSGKSTLLNALFGTTFQQLNRKTRVGQTTKGIWYTIDTKSSMMILDIEGSDSFERQQRTKFERRNSLFALAVSHTLLINLWIQQVGLYKGSQLSILQAILELNLRLFGNEEPKNIIFVIRDFYSVQQNIEGIKQKIFNKVEQAWKNIKKPPGKQHVELKDLFKLEAYFLPSKLEDPDEFKDEVKKLANHLFQIAASLKIISKNVAMSDIPQFMKNLWETISLDKDINIPEQKFLLSNMKCHQIKNQIFSLFQEQFRDELEKSERKMNIDFAANTRRIVGKMFHQYDQETSSYHPTESGKVKEQFVNEVERKIEISFSHQVKHIVNESLHEFTDEVNKLFLKDKGIENIKNLKPQAQQKFATLLERVSYKKEWMSPELKKFEKSLVQTFENLKQKIVIDSLKDIDRSIKKQIENIVSLAFYEKKIFTQCFWEHLNKSFKQLEYKAKNSILNLYKKLEFRGEQQKSPANKSIKEHIERARNNANQELRTIIKMKCNDLLYYMMRHFSVQFNLNQEGIPRQWPSLKPQQIALLYENSKKKYVDMIGNFASFQLKQDKTANEIIGALPKMVSRYTVSNIESEGNQLLNSIQMMSLKKKLEDMMNNEYQEAIKKNKEVYQGAIPKWGWALFLIVAFDDILLWLSNPAFAIPLTLILIIVAGIFFYGGPTFANSLLSGVRNTATSTIGSFAARATTSMMKNK